MLGPSDRRLPKVVSDVTTKEMGEELLLFRRFGKDVVSLSAAETKLFRLCEQRACFQDALAELGHSEFMTALSVLQEKELTVPTTVPRVNQSGWVQAEVCGERLIYLKGSSDAVLLNKPLNLVLGLCDGATTVEAAVKVLQGELRQPSEACEEILWASVAELKKMGCLVAPTPTALSRRDFISKWATAAAVFPIVSSVLLPAPAAAVSTGCIVDGDPPLLGGGGGCNTALGIGTRINQCCPCTTNLVPPCSPNTFCQQEYVSDGTSCLDDSFRVVAPGQFRCGFLSPSPDPTSNAQTDCASARASSQGVIFGSYACCRCF